MEELRKYKKIDDIKKMYSEVQTIEEPQDEVEKEQLIEQEEEVVVHKHKKSTHTHKQKEEKERSGPGIVQNFHLATHRTLSTTERIIRSLSNAYEHIFIGDGSTNATFEKDQGLKFFSKGLFKKALGHLEACLENGNENDPDVLYMIAICFVSEDHHKKALEYFYRAHELKPADYDIIIEFAKCLYQLERYDDALIYFKKANDLNMEEPDNYYHMANCLEKNEQIEDARKMYKKAIDLNPREAVYYHALGFLYENSGDHKDAIVCFKKAMDLERERGGGKDKPSN